LGSGIAESAADDLLHFTIMQVNTGPKHFGFTIDDLGFARKLQIAPIKARLHRKLR
jgi:hypothetical protein